MPRLTILAAALVVAAGCSDSTGPTNTHQPGLRIVASPPLQDTIGARPAQALVVEVRDSGGVVRPGLVVRFESLPLAVTVHCCPFYPVLLTTLAGSERQFLVADTVDAQGRAAVLLHFGGWAGSAAMRVTVPELGLADTVTLTILPGDAMHLVLFPPDTALMVGGSSVQPRALMLDRNFNERGDSVGLTTIGTLLTAESGGRFHTGAQTGRAMIVGSRGVFRDTMMVSVVPTGVIAAYQSHTGPNIVIADTDGGNRRVISSTHTSTEIGGPSWAADGQSIVHRQVVGGNPHLYRTSLTTPTQSASLSNLSDAGWPSSSRDGQWVYFSSNSVGSYNLWRMRADGTQQEHLSPIGAGTEWRPSISKDGNLLAFVGSGPLIHVRDLGTGTTFATGRHGQVPKFSPVEDRIAFLTGSGNGAVAIMDIDGSNVVTVTTTSDFGESLDWSPDGKWLIARRGGDLVLIDVATHELLPLVWSGALNYASWRP